MLSLPTDPRSQGPRVAWHPNVSDGKGSLRRARKSAEKLARAAAQTSGAYSELLAEGTQHRSKEDWRNASRSYREAIVLRPELPEAYFNLGNVLSRSGHIMESAIMFLEAKERVPVGSETWARATAAAFDMLRLKECGEVAKPEWWSDEGLKALSASVVRSAPNDVRANSMRALILSGLHYGVWHVPHRSSAELLEAAEHFERAAVHSNAPSRKAELYSVADQCLVRAEADQVGCKWCEMGCRSAKSAKAALWRGKQPSPTSLVGVADMPGAMPGVMPGAMPGVEPGAMPGVVPGVAAFVR